MSPTDAVIYLGVGVLGLSWLYVAARVVTRGILRSISNHKRRG